MIPEDIGMVSVGFLGRAKWYFIGLAVEGIGIGIIGLVHLFHLAYWMNWIGFVLIFVGTGFIAYGLRNGIQVADVEDEPYDMMT